MLVLLLQAHARAHAYTRFDINSFVFDVTWYCVSACGSFDLDLDYIRFVLCHKSFFVQKFLNENHMIQSNSRSFPVCENKKKNHF